ncbi:MAG: glycoside hydrolase family 25 protein [Ruminiclostridium sp.]|nr:glycoside hydrolase family 25 protein [Ruminiclostridium sp.]
MSENRLNDNELEFDDEIDFDGLDDFEEETEVDEEYEDTEETEYEPELTEDICHKEDDSAADSEEMNLQGSISYDETEEASETSATEKNEISEEDVHSAAEFIPVEKQTCTTQKSSENISVNRFCIINTAVSAVTLCAVAAGIALGYNYISSIEKDLEIKSAEIAELEKKNDALEEDYLEAVNLVEVESKKESDLSEISIEHGKISFYDSSVGYSWTPILEGIAKNEYKKENFTIDNRGRLSYIEDGESSSYFGIDVSSYQGDIDWQLVKEDNVEFAFLRIGYRGYGEEGKLCPDEKFVDNYSGAHDAGIDLGIYFFSQATSVDEAVEEANYVLSLLEGRTLEYPIVFDWETVQTGDPEDIPRTEDVMPQTLTLSAIAFCETIRDAGYDAMIYTNKKLATIKYDMRQLQDYPVWLAYYDTELNYCYDFDIWQYGTGQVDGIEGEVDINIAIIK